MHLHAYAIADSAWCTMSASPLSSDNQRSSRERGGLGAGWWSRTSACSATCKDHVHALPAGNPRLSTVVGSLGYPSACHRLQRVMAGPRRHASRGAISGPTVAGRCDGTNPRKRRDAVLWRTLLRDVVSPLIGLGILLHEVLVAAEPRYLAVLTGLILLGIPVDAAVRALAGWRGLPPPGPPSSPPTIPPSPSSSSGASPGGSPPTGIERSVDAADA